LKEGEKNGRIPQAGQTYQKEKTEVPETKRGEGRSSIQFTSLKGKRRSFDSVEKERNGSTEDSKV